MRDTHRIKEKYELSLDNRHVVILTMVSLLTLGGVFVLGVVVGKKLATEPHSTSQGDVLSLVDSKTSALADLQRDASLTFQDELTKKAEVPSPVRTPDPSREEPRGPSLAERAAEVATAPEPTPTPAPPRAAPLVRPEPALEPGPKPEAPPNSTLTRPIDAGPLREALAKVGKPPEPKEAKDHGGWSLQLAAYQDRAEAERFAAGLRDKGYAPYIVQASLAGRGTWYRVRMGQFPSKEAATRYLADFKRETSLNAIVAQP